MDVSVEDISTIGRDADVMEDTAPRERHPEPLPVGGSLGVAVQGNWVMGPGDCQPLAVVGTSRPAGRSKEHKMRKLITAMAIGGALAAGGIVVAGPASADGPCGGAVVLGNGGGRCDYDQRRDGSFTRCDTVYVLGFGGTNCYLVYPPPPADAPAAA